MNTIVNRETRSALWSRAPCPWPGSRRAFGVGQADIGVGNVSPDDHVIDEEGSVSELRAALGKPDPASHRAGFIALVPIGGLDRVGRRLAQHD